MMRRPLPQILQGYTHIPETSVYRNLGDPGHATALKILDWMRLLKILHQPFVEK